MNSKKKLIIFVIQIDYHVVSTFILFAGQYRPEKQQKLLDEFFYTFQRFSTANKFKNEYNNKNR